MDRAALQRHLDAAGLRASRGEFQVERQRETVDRLRRSGWDSGKAEELLVEFELAQTVHLADVDWLRAQLASTS